jgi:hypothetical protein
MTEKELNSQELIDERTKPMYANKFKKARKQRFKRFNLWNDKITPNASPQKKLEDSINIRKSIMDQALITKGEKILHNKEKYYSKKLSNLAICGVKRSAHTIGGLFGSDQQRYEKTFSYYQEKCWQSTANLAMLQNRKLNSSFDKYMRTGYND